MPSLAQSLNCPFPLQSRDKTRTVKAKVGRKVFNGPLLALVSNQTLWPAVSSLLRRVGPAAVFWPVTGVDIYTVKRGPVGAFAHIRQEIFKRLPPITNGDAARSVPRIINAARTLASAFHGFPRAVCARPTVAVRPDPAIGRTFPRAKSGALATYLKLSGTGFASVKHGQTCGTSLHAAQEQTVIL